MRRGVVLLVLSLLVSGCHEQWGGSSWGSGSSGDADAAAQSNVRATIPAIEAYYADNGTYEGATSQGLRATYDEALPEVEIDADAQTYCVQSTVGAASYFKPGPAADIFPGHCGDAVPQPPPAVSYDNPEANIRAAIPAIEAWYADHDSYKGMTIERLREEYDYGIPTALELSQITRTNYCLESTVTNMTYSFRGPAGPVTRGAC